MSASELISPWVEEQAEANGNQAEEKRGFSIFMERSRTASRETRRPHTQQGVMDSRIKVEHRGAVVTLNIESPAKRAQTAAIGRRTPSPIASKGGKKKSGGTKKKKKKASPSAPPALPESPGQLAATNYRTILRPDPLGGPGTMRAQLCFGPSGSPARGPTKSAFTRFLEEHRKRQCVSDEVRRLKVKLKDAGPRRPGTHSPLNPRSLAGRWSDDPAPPPYRLRTVESPLPPSPPATAGGGASAVLLSPLPLLPWQDPARAGFPGTPGLDFSARTAAAFTPLPRAARTAGAPGMTAAPGGGAWVSCGPIASGPLAATLQALQGDGGRACGVGKSLALASLRPSPRAEAKRRQTFFTSPEPAARTVHTGYSIDGRPVQGRLSPVLRRRRRRKKKRGRKKKAGRGLCLPPPLPHIPPPPPPPRSPINGSPASPDRGSSGSWSPNWSPLPSDRPRNAGSPPPLRARPRVLMPPSTRGLASDRSRLAASFKAGHVLRSQLDGGAFEGADAALKHARADAALARAMRRAREQRAQRSAALDRVPGSPPALSGGGKKAKKKKGSPKVSRVKKAGRSHHLHARRNKREEAKQRKAWAQGLLTRTQPSLIPVNV